MLVKELISLLSQCDPHLSVAVHANNNTYMSGIDEETHGELRVCLLKTSEGIDHILIGNPYHRDLNEPNWYIEKELDGKSPLKKVYRYR